MNPHKQSLRRYTFELTPELYDQLSKAAEENQTTIVQVLRVFIKLGLLAIKPGTVVLIREGDVEQPIMLVM